jgi:hypothetical protein
MVIKLKSPYNDDETRTKRVAKVVEDWIKDNWSLSGIDVDSIGWGIPLRLMDQSGKDIILKINTFHSSMKPYVYGGGRWMFTDNMLLDCYIVDRESNMGGDDPRAVLIQKYLEEKVIINQSESVKGIYTLTPKGFNITPDDVRVDLTRVMGQLDAVYLADVIDE